MILRFAATALIIVMAVSMWRQYNRRSLYRLGQQITVTPIQTMIALDTPVPMANTPTILYFSTMSCVPCRTQQAPTLAQLQTEQGETLHVIHIDCEQQPEVADRWGVFSTPTTFILNTDQQPVAVNRGVASLNTLRQQLQLNQVNAVDRLIPA